MRSIQPGWEAVAMHDPSGRRGVWYRAVTTNGSPSTPALYQSVEVCAGREGDDEYVRLDVGATITPRMLYDLVGVLSSGAWAYRLGKVSR